MCSEHDDGNFFAVFSQTGKELQAIHARHFEVGNDDARLPGAHFFKGFEAITSGFSAITPSGNQLGKARKGMRLVFHNEDFFLACHV